MPGLDFDSRSFFGTENVENLETVRLGSSSPEINAKRVVLYDTSGNPIINPASGSSIVTGTKTVTTAGTAQQLSASSVPIKGIWVNADLIVGIVMTVGDASVVGNAAGMRGLILTPGNPPIFLAITNLNLLYVDAQSNGGRLSYAYLPQ